MDHVARAQVLIGAPPQRVWDVLTGPEPRPEIMFGARTVTDWVHHLKYVLEPVDGGTTVVLEQDNNPTAESARHNADNWRMMLDGLKKVAESSP